MLQTILFLLVAVVLILIGTTNGDSVEKQCDAKGGFLVHSHTTDELICISKGAILK